MNISTCQSKIVHCLFICNSPMYIFCWKTQFVFSQTINFKWNEYLKLSETNNLEWKCYKSLSTKYSSVHHLIKLYELVENLITNSLNPLWKKFIAKWNNPTGRIKPYQLLASSHCTNTWNAFYHDVAVGSLGMPFPANIRPRLPWCHH